MSGRLMNWFGIAVERATPRVLRRYRYRIWRSVRLYEAYRCDEQYRTLSCVSRLVVRLMG